MTTRPSNPDHPASDREALSALFDGELAGDVARFALKRLDHDQEWRSACERWQRVGDVLRNRNAPLPVTFQSRLRDAVHADAAHGARKGAKSTRAGLRWASAALVASAAVVAVFLAGGPFGDVAAPAGEQVADAPAPAAAKLQFASQAPLEPAIDLDTATAAVGVTAAAALQRNRNLQRDRAATDRIVSAAMAAHSPVTADAGPTPIAQPVADDIAMRDIAADATPASPFTGAATPDARPWPRAVLPQYRERGGALAADFATAPSFYPFVPAAPAPGTDDAAGAPADPATTTPSPQPPTP